jgi:hypothetical protein
VSTSPVETPPVESAPASTTTRPARPRSFSDPALTLPGAGASGLFARTDDSLYRIELRSGLVTRTDGAGIGTPSMGGRGGPVSMIAGPRQVLITETDSGAGVMVRDGHPAEPLPRGLQLPAQIFPGPPGYLWVYSTERSPARINLVDTTGRHQRATLDLDGAWPQTDGRGNLLLSDVGGVYEASPNRLRRLTSGSVTAVGPGHYLLVDCDPSRRCSTYLYDRSTRRQRRIGPADTSDLTTGTLSPDGRHAALIQWRGSGRPSLLVRDLADGTERVVPGVMDQQGTSDVASTLLWTPDSRWLITLLEGHVTFFDTTTGRLRTSGSALPTIAQLALRTSPDS